MAQAVLRQKGPSSHPWNSGLHSTLKDFANKDETIKLDSQTRPARTSESQSFHNRWQPGVRRSSVRRTRRFWTSSRPLFPNQVVEEFPIIRHPSVASQKRVPFSYPKVVLCVGLIRYLSRF